ncbi:hypothetical protein, variant 3 [Aphanomyces invadans]|uniref:Inward rectifier potassium channel C-terminal domain-containing protein n=1 Tax=Aphanomyces invadans TaxID=157072 RepID=A0A024TD57_9STRA|nr:hypothetical protein, variant 3 [Aphanomyces invadans]XP_008879551.1 hypothetical protein, variant 2 [Aphanomyces invadans]ETV91913.1 hypothetical protein, variant 2 [Aphanomyces invadans]ETV91914.1 hypothetical protein, variant 3 [Aphanomyces invadans]|eukprot:XP_008879549.1 hypothetical protein, variant 3 [Aphanomyces invadans]
MGMDSISRTGGNWKQIYWNDVYHTVINVKTRSLILGVAVAYVLVTLFFAVMYLVVSYNDEKCNVGIKTLAEAYIFSIETIMTIGYGAPTNDIFYGSCGSMALLLTLESFSGIFINSLMVGMFFIHFSRASTRAQSIVFTNNAVIRRIRDEYYFIFQVCERRKHQLVEAHIRCYAVRDEIDANGDETVFQTHSMRLQQPDDDLGSYLLMAMPQLVVHRIDQWSPLYPPECRPQGAHYNATTNQAYPDPLQRAVDHDNGNRDYDPDVSLPQSPTREAIERHFARTNMEIVVILEGEDSTTSNTAQARHSYRLSDIVWDHMFARCVKRHPETKGVWIDFDEFHDLVSVSTNAGVVVGTASVF